MRVLPLIPTDAGGRRRLRCSRCGRLAKWAIRPSQGKPRKSCGACAIEQCRDEGIEVPHGVVAEPKPRHLKTRFTDRPGPKPEVVVDGPGQRRLEKLMEFWGTSKRR